MKKSSDDFERIGDLLAYLEQVSGLGVCLKRFGSSGGLSRFELYPPGRFRQHQKPFCKQVKITHTDRCCQCDLRDIPEKALRHFLPFFNRCHANATELIVPLKVGGELAGIAYLGPFREEANQPASLPWLDPREKQQLYWLGTLLQRFIQYEGEYATKETEGFSRASRIRRFIQERMRDDVTLHDLGRLLGVSASRAGHLVKELTGKSFVDLKAHYRLELAQKLLASSMLSVESIAAEAGFSDPRYFYRIFKKATGVAPGEWRSQHQKPWDA